MPSFGEILVVSGVAVTSGVVAGISVSVGVGGMTVCVAVGSTSGVLVEAG